MKYGFAKKKFCPPHLDLYFGTLLHCKKLRNNTVSFKKTMKMIILGNERS
jgi:hypothetical protein